MFFISKKFSNIAWLLKHVKSSFKFILLAIFFTSISAILNVYLASITKNLIDNATNKNLELLKSTIFSYVILYIISISLNPICNYLKAYISLKTKNSIQKKIYIKVLNSKFSSISNLSSMDIVSRCTSDVDTISILLSNTIPTLISLSVTFISAFISVTIISPEITILFIIILPVFFIFSKLFAYKQKKFYKALQNKQVSYKTFIQESIKNINILKIFCTENFSIQNLEKKQQDIMKLSLKQTIANTLANLCLLVGTKIGYLLTFLFGLKKILNSTLSFGEFTASIQLYTLVQAPLISITNYLPNIVASLAAIERLRDLEISCVEELHSLFINHCAKSKIKFDNVSFSYDSKKEILNKLSFDIKVGDIVGIIGSSGAGKTTLLNLVLNLLETSTGEITINNFKTNKLYRQFMSYVPQGNTLFSTTIRNNIAFNNYNKNLMDFALENSLAKEFVDNLDLGIDTVIGESSTKLSEGQIQRLCIARALYRKSPILILDEVTSALDLKTELNLLENLKKLDYKPIIIMVTHRPAPLKICNKILEL